ncbi:MAG: NAD-dependent dehydratase [Acidobacteria bacterium]|nr:MAG: NAD-dependent dehydratase [Acidobacteriota bacterium]
MTALVTGAAGFVGNHVVRLLAERGERIRVLLRPTSQTTLLEGLAVERVSGDLRDRASLDKALDGVRTVYHVAADYRLWARDPREIYESNVQGTRNLLEAARRAKVDRFVYTSTVGTVAVPRGGGPPDESIVTSLDEMIGAYKRSKWLAEQEARKAAEAGLPVVIVNPTTPVGPGDAKPTPTGRIIIDFLNGRMPAYVDTGLNFVPVEDAAAGHLLAAGRGRIGERYILGGENLTLKQALEILSQVSGRPAPRVRVPHILALAAGYADAALSRLMRREPQIPLEGVRMARHSMFVNSERARAELGFSPGPVTAAFERAVRWYESNGYVRIPRRNRMAAARAA